MQQEKQLRTTVRTLQVSKTKEMQENLPFPEAIHMVNVYYSH